jgi:hypothetical protein
LAQLLVQTKADLEALKHKLHDAGAQGDFAPTPSPVTVPARQRHATEF